MGKTRRYLWKFWEWVSHGHTLLELLQLAGASKMVMGLSGCILGLISIVFSSIPVSFYPLVILGGAAIGLFFSNEIEGKRIQRRRLALAATLFNNHSTIVLKKFAKYKMGDIGFEPMTFGV